MQSAAAPWDSAPPSSGWGGGLSRSMGGAAGAEGRRRVSAALAAVALAPRPAPPGVALGHLHAARVSLREQAATVAAALRGGGALTFFDLAGEDAEPPVVVARFLAVLELYRHAALSFEQVEPLGELTLRWTAERWSQENLATLGADYDR